jgi:Kef-type K+ transport system membrane component KefB
MSSDAVTALVIADIALVLGLSSMLGALVRRWGQPPVIGQLLTGIALGPSLLGRLPGDLTSHLFPPAVLPSLSVLAQVGVVVFMFGVAYETDLRMEGRGRPVVVIALSVVLVPMTLGSGAVLAFPHLFATAGQSPDQSLILFTGVATSITALPVLAAIVREQGLAGTTIGVIATSAAGLMDVLVWLALAAAVTGAAPRGNLAVTALLAAGLVAVMLLVVRPVLRWWFNRPAAVLTQQLPAAIVLTMASAYATMRLGLHPAFGGFLAGLTMSRVRGQGPDTDVLRSMDSASNLLLPLFFAYAGLSLTISSPRLADLGLLALIVVIACAGKLGPGYLAARLSGLERGPAATIAVLLNTRGLTELVALNIGLQAKVISPTLYSIFVLMALMTTIATSPLLSLIRSRSERGARPERARPASRWPIRPRRSARRLPGEIGQQQEAQHPDGAER